MPDQDHAKAQAQAQYEGIVEMVENLKIAMDDDAFEEAAEHLARDAGFLVSETLNEDDSNGTGWFWYKADTDSEEDDLRYCTKEEAWIACCDENDLRPSQDDAERAIQEDPLSVQIRSGWVSPGEKMEADEFEILLCTGGPACRIRGELNHYNEPYRAWLEYQDWGTPWTQYFDVEQDMLLEYAQQFYFGVG